MDFLVSRRRQDRNSGKNLLVNRILYFLAKVLLNGYIGGSKIKFLIFWGFDAKFMNFERIIKWAIRNRLN